MGYSRRRLPSFFCLLLLLPHILRPTFALSISCLIFLLLPLPLSDSKSPSSVHATISPSALQQQQQQDQEHSPLTQQKTPAVPRSLVNDETEASQGQHRVHDEESRKLDSPSAATDQHSSESYDSFQEPLARETLKILSFPSVLHWGHQELFSPSQKALTIVNTLNDTGLRVSQLYSSNPNFHVVGFRETLLPPAGMLAAHVIFLPTDMALVEGVLVVQTSIGAVSVVMQGLGVAPSYRLLEAISIQQPPLCPLDEPFQPSIALQVSKNVGVFSAPVDGKVALKDEWTVITVYPIQVSMIPESKLMFPDTPVGEKQVHWLKVMNPSDSPVLVELLVNSVVEKISEKQDAIQCGTNYLNSGTRRCDGNECSMPSSKDSVFILSGGVGKVILKPNSTDEIGPLIFHPREQRAMWRSNLILLNNLTGFEWMAIEGRGMSPTLMFFDGKDAVCSLEVEVNCQLLSSFSKWTLKEQIDTLLDENNAREVCYQRTSKEFFAKNLGNSPLQVESLMLSGSHGFKIDSFHGFHLAPGESAKLLVSYYPDIRNGPAHEGELQLVTASGMFSVSLKAHIPENMLFFCKRAQLLSAVKRVFLQVCLVALFFVLLVFGKMLKQESVRSDVKEWPSVGKPPQHPGISSSHYQDDGKANITQKKPSIYVSIDFDCTQSEVKQCNSFLCFSKALHTVHSAIAHIANIDYLYNPQLKIKIWAVRDIVAVISKRNDKNDTISNMMLEKNGNGSVLSGKATSSQTRVSSLSGPRISSLPRKGKTSKVSLLPLEKPEAMQSTATSSVSEKEKEKTGKKKRRKNGVSIPVDIDNSSDGSCHSPLSTPSSPLKQSASCRSVSLLVKGTHTNGQVNSELVSNRALSGGKDIIPQTEAARNKGMTEEIFESGVLATRHGRCSTNPEGSLQIKTTKSSVSNFEQSMKHGALSPFSKEQKAKPSKTRVDATSPAISAAFAATKSNSKVKSHAAEGHMAENVTSANESRLLTEVSMWTLASGPNLVSISAVAPHARAPGTPLVSTTAGTLGVVDDPNNLWCRDGCVSRSSSLSSSKVAPDVKAGAGTSSPSSSPPSSPLPSSSSPSPSALATTSEHNMILYDIWGDHFVEIGRNLLPEEDPTTKIPFFSGPQAPAFSVFSCTYPFHVHKQTDKN